MGAVVLGTIAMAAAIVRCAGAAVAAAAADATRPLVLAQWLPNRGHRSERRADSRLPRRPARTVDTLRLAAVAASPRTTGTLLAERASPSARGRNAVVGRCCDPLPDGSMAVSWPDDDDAVAAECSRVSSGRSV